MQMTFSDPCDTLLMVIPEAYFLYKGFYRNVEVRIQGQIGRYGDNRHTRLRVKLYWEGHEISWCARSGKLPFKTLATARKHAKAYAASVIDFAATGRSKGWPERSGYDAHVCDHRRHMLDTYRDEPAIYEHHLRRTSHLREPCPIAA